MVLISDGNSLTVAHVKLKGGKEGLSGRATLKIPFFAASLRHLIKSRAVTNRILLSEKKYFPSSVRKLPSNISIKIRQ